MGGFGGGWEWKEFICFIFIRFDGLPPVERTVEAMVELKWYFCLFSHSSLVSKIVIFFFLFRSFLVMGFFPFYSVLPEVSTKRCYGGTTYCVVTGPFQY